MKKNLNNQRQFSKLFFLLVVVALMMPAVLQAQSGKPNFSGSWTMNAEKSQMGQGGGGQGGFGGRMGGGDLVVKQDANTLTVERTRPGRDGGSPVTTSLKYTLDGKESVNASQMGDSKSVATWSADGKSLKIVTTRAFNDMSITTTEEWSMNGANLSVKNTSTTPNGDMTSVIVYDKK